MAKPNTPPEQPAFYQPQDFAIGTTIEVGSRVAVTREQDPGVVVRCVLAYPHRC